MPDALEAKKRSEIMRGNKLISLSTVDVTRIDGRKFVSKLQTHTMLTLTNMESITSIFYELIQLSRYNSSDNFLIFLPKSHISVNIDTFNHTKLIDFSYLVFNVSKLLGR